MATKGLLPDTQFTDLNQINLWLGEKTSDPDVLELKGKVKLMADNLQKTIGGGQGGQWAFEVADTLLNPAYQGPGFERRMKSHGSDLSALAASRRGFGKREVAGEGLGPPIESKPTGDPIAQLKEAALSGNRKAQSYLKSKGISWQP